MRLDVRKCWKCVAWVGPDGETGHGLWQPVEEFVQDDGWCRHMDSLYPGWKHSITERLGKPEENTPEGWEQHPLYGNMENGPMEV